MQKAQVVPSLGRSVSPFQQTSRGSSSESIPLLGSGGPRPPVALYSGDDDDDDEVKKVTKERRRRKGNNYKSEKEEQHDDDDDDDDEETSLLGTRRLTRPRVQRDDDASASDEEGLRRRRRKNKRKGAKSNEGGDDDDDDDDEEEEDDDDVTRPLSRGSGRASGGGGGGGGGGGVSTSWDSAMRMSTSCVRRHTSKVYCCLYLSASNVILLTCIFIYVSLGWNYQPEPWTANQVYYVKRNAGVAAGMYAFIAISLFFLVFRDRRFLFSSFSSSSSARSPAITLRETEMTTSARYYRNSRD